MDTIDQAQNKMKAVIEHLKIELKTIRTGRANAGMLDTIHVEVYGSPMRLRDIANITTPEPRQLLVSPFDRSHAAAIAKGIEKANLGFQAIVETGVVRINIPAMDQAMRQVMVKECHKKCEETKVSLRHVRRDILEALKKQKANGDISEDVLKGFEKKVQDLTDRFCKEADDLAAAKEKEVSTV